jgi:hypothetical protein
MLGAGLYQRTNWSTPTAKFFSLVNPESVQKLQMALHAKAKAEANYRFYVLYDKISRADIPARSYAGKWVMTE